MHFLRLAVNSACWYKVSSRSESVYSKFSWLFVQGEGLDSKMHHPNGGHQDVHRQPEGHCWAAAYTHARTHTHSHSYWKFLCRFPTACLETRWGSESKPLPTTSPTIPWTARAPPSSPRRRSVVPAALLSLLSGLRRNLTGLYLNVT